MACLPLPPACDAALSLNTHGMWLSDILVVMLWLPSLPLSSTHGRKPHAFKPPAARAAFLHAVLWRGELYCSISVSSFCDTFPTRVLCSPHSSRHLSSGVTVAGRTLQFRQHAFAPCDTTPCLPHPLPTPATVIPSTIDHAVRWTTCFCSVVVLLPPTARTTHTYACAAHAFCLPPLFSLLHAFYLPCTPCPIHAA